MNTKIFINEETKNILSELLNCSVTEVYLKELSFDTIQRLNTIYKLRGKNYPLQYILQKANFFGYNFKVTDSTFIPRPETELLVEETLKIVKTPQLNILDVGTGCGNIAIVIKKFLKNSTVFAVDISKKALEIAKENIKKFNVEIFVINIDFFNFYTKKYFDIILSNPPYISENELPYLQPEIKFEPPVALIGGKKGQEFIIKLIEKSKDILKPDGYLIFEIGYNQIYEILKHTDGYKVINIVKDYQKIPRIIILKKK